MFYFKEKQIFYLYSTHRHRASPDGWESIEVNDIFSAENLGNLVSLFTYLCLVGWTRETAKTFSTFFRNFKMNNYFYLHAGFRHSHSHTHTHTHIHNNSRIEGCKKCSIRCKNICISKTKNGLDFGFSNFINCSYNHLDYSFKKDHPWCN